MGSQGSSSINSWIEWAWSLTWMPGAAVAAAALQRMSWQGLMPRLSGRALQHQVDQSPAPGCCMLSMELRCLQWSEQLWTMEQ